MDRKDKWPFLPDEILRYVDKELLRFVLTGLCESLPSPAVLYIKERGEIRPVYPKIDKMRLYPEICRFLNENCKELCKKDSFKRAEKFWNSIESKRKEECHLGLTIYSRKIELYGQCVAICSAGKFIETKDQKEVIREKLYKLISDNSCPFISPEEIKSFLRDPKIRPFEDFEKSKKRFNSFEDFKKKFENSLERLKDFLNYYISQYRKSRERELQNKISNFFFELQRTENQKGKNSEGKKYDLLEKELDRLKEEGGLRQTVLKSLQAMKHFLGLPYVALFLSNEPEDRVLELFVQDGLPSNSLQVHFNWRKAGLELSGFDVRSWFNKFNNKDYKDYREELKKLYEQGFKGGDRQYFDNMSFVLPASLNLKSLLVLGPFGDAFNIEHIFREEELREFLINICFFIISQTVILRLNHKLKQKDLLRRNIVVLTAHSLRSRLHHILNQLYFIRKGKDLAPLKRAEEIIVTLGEQVKRLMEASDRAIIGEIDRSRLNLEEFSLSAMIENVVESFYEKVRDKDGLEEIKIHDSIWKLPRIYGDKVLLDICFSNLIDNAIKYSLKGYIKVYGGIQGQEVLVSIQDRGWGIPEDQKDKIFEYEFQSDKLVKPFRKGLGIGLTLARKIARLHGGDILVTSKPYREGSSLKDHLVTFTVKIPLKKGV